MQNLKCRCFFHQLTWREYSAAVFAKHTQCMPFDDIDLNDPQFTRITKGYSKKELCVFLQFLFSLEENCRIFCVA